MKPLGATDPSMVAGYRLHGILGGGGMGRVYLGEAPDGRLVAIKLIRADLAESHLFRRRFAREVAAARAVSTRFTASVLDADLEAEQPWLATAYIDGPSLDQWVGEHGPLYPGAVLTLAAGLAEALASIHALGLVHRDLKPGNVLLDDRGPHIIDFGIALAAEETSRLTTSLVGTPSYMAPERLHGDEAAAPADVFALGATLVFAASGRRMVNDGTMYEQIMQITSGRFDLSDVPRELRPLIRRCISHRPKDRPTAAELSRMLARWGIAGPESGWYRSDTPVPPLAASQESRPGRLSRRKALAFGGVLGAAVIGGGVGAAAGLFRGGTHTASGPPAPGTVLWQARSGNQPLATANPAGERILVLGGNRIVTANAAQVHAVDVAGRQVWSHNLGSAGLTLRRWGDAVLVTDAQHAWLLDPASGTPRFAVDLARSETAAAGTDNPDHLPVEIHGVALTGDRAFVDLGTATVAIDRTGRQVWRRPRPALADGTLGPAGDPRAAGAGRLVTQDIRDGTVQVGLYDAGTGREVWTCRYPAATPLPPPTRPGAGPPPDAGPDDPAWRRLEARFADRYVVLRDAEQIQVRGLADGAVAWQQMSPRPVAAVELIGQLVLVAADRFSAYSVADGVSAWQVSVRGARVAATPGTVLLAADQAVTALDTDGRTRWQVPLPQTVAEATPDRLRVDGAVAYLTFLARANRTRPLDVDVLAIALGSG